jgi:cell division protein ZapA (FtsZ GTPase activity inhibitor)
LSAVAPRKEHIDTVLLTVWFEAGNIKRASEATGTPESTIRRWLEIHNDRFHELRRQNEHRFDELIASRAEGIQLQAFETIAKLVEKVDQDLENGQVRNPDQAAQRLATVLGIVTDKWLLIKGRPNNIVGTQDASEHMRSLAQKFPWLVVDSTAEDVTDAEADPETKR